MGERREEESGGPATGERGRGGGLAARRGDGGRLRPTLRRGKPLGFFRPGLPGPEGGSPLLAG